MPNFDGKGPKGKGPMTGGGMGFCAIPLTSPEQELDYLANQANVLQAQLKQVKARIKKLEKKEAVSR